MNFTAFTLRLFALAALPFLLSAEARAQVTCTHIGTEEVELRTIARGELPCVAASIRINELQISTTTTRCPSHIEVVPSHGRQRVAQGYYISGRGTVPKYLYAYECMQHSFLIFTTGSSCRLAAGPNKSGDVVSYEASLCPLDRAPTGVVPIPQG